MLRHRLVDLGAPVVDGDQHRVRLGGGGQEGPGVGDQLSLGHLDPTSPCWVAWYSNISQLTLKSIQIKFYQYAGPSPD